jgi:hypothetical protein
MSSGSRLVHPNPKASQTLLASTLVDPGLNRITFTLSFHLHLRANALFETQDFHHKNFMTKHQLYIKKWDSEPFFA